MGKGKDISTIDNAFVFTSISIVIGRGGAVGTKFRMTLGKIA